MHRYNFKKKGPVLHIIANHDQMRDPLPYEVVIHGDSGWWLTTIGKGIGKEATETAVVAAPIIVIKNQFNK